MVETAIRVETIPIYTDNYAYLAICQQTGQGAAVDPADPDTVLQRADELGVEISAIWTTHHHHDHSGGNDDLVGACAERGWTLELAGGKDSPLAGLTHELADGDEINIGNLCGRAVHVPGHTHDGIVYLIGGAAFTGDTLFRGGCGRLFEGDPPTMYRSLSRLSELPEETQVYCGHEYAQRNLSFAQKLEPGNEDLARGIRAVVALRSQGLATVPSTIGEELLTNPFLRCHSVEIQQSLGLVGADPVEVFAEVRRRRNRW